MESASIAAPPGSEAGGKGLKTGAIGYISNLVIGVASTAPAYSLAATLGLRGRDRRDGRARAGDHDRLLRPDAADRGGLQLHEQGRPRLRHQLHLGDPGDGAPVWAGSPAGRSSSPTSSSWRRSPTSPASTPSCSSGSTPRPPTHLTSASPRRMDRRDDLDLLRRDRALGAHAVRPARDRDPHAHPLRRRRAGQGLRDRGSGIRPYRPGLVLPVRAKQHRADRRRPARRVHLLGLGLGRVRQRGVRRTRPTGPARRRS